MSFSKPANIFTVSDFKRNRSILWIKKKKKKKKNVVGLYYNSQIAGDTRLVLEKVIIGIQKAIKMIGKPMNALSNPKISEAR